MYFSFSVICSFSGNDSSLDVYCLFFVCLSLKMPNTCLKIIGVVDLLPFPLKKHFNQFLFNILGIGEKKKVQSYSHELKIIRLVIF